MHSVSHTRFLWYLLSSSLNSSLGSAESLSFFLLVKTTVTIDQSRHKLHWTSDATWQKRVSSLSVNTIYHAYEHIFCNETSPHSHHLLFHRKWQIRSHSVKKFSSGACLLLDSIKRIRKIVMHGSDSEQDRWSGGLHVYVSMCHPVHPHSSTLEKGPSLSLSDKRW